MSRIGKSPETENRLVVAWGWGGWREEQEVRDRVSFGGRQKCLTLIVVTVEQLCGYMKIHWTPHFKWVNSMLCELYFNKTVIL